MKDCKTAVAIFFILSLMAVFVPGVMAEQGGASANSTEALLEHLKKYGTLSEGEAEALKREFVKSGNETDVAPPPPAREKPAMPAAVEAAPLPAAVPEAPKDDMREAVAPIAGPSPLSPVVPVAPAEAPPEEMAMPIEEPVMADEADAGVGKDVREEIQRVEERMDRMTDQLLQKDRLSERRIEELEKKVNEDIAKKVYQSSWAQRFKIGADLRLRYQGNLYDEENVALLDPSEPSETLNTQSDRHRFRYRVRVGAKAKIVDPRETNVGKLEAALRLSSGNDGDPISTNDTFGDYQNKDNILIDRAYLKWSYVPWEPIWNKLPQITLWGGRIPNPWFSTDLVWDGDLNFEGMAVSFNTDTQDWNKWNGFFTIGAFPLQEEAFSQRDKWLYGAQLGVEVRPSDILTCKFGLSYYDYTNVEGIVNAPGDDDQYDFTAPLSLQKGNALINIDPSGDTLLALGSDYNLANLTARVDISRFYPVNLSLVGDLVYNLGFNKDDIVRVTNTDDYPEDVLGYMVGFEAGYPSIQEYGAWKTALYYKYLESDAVLDAFSDSDFHDGGTNAKGWVFSIWYGLYKNVCLKATYMTADAIREFVTVDSENDLTPVYKGLAIDTVQLDLIAEF